MDKAFWREIIHNQYRLPEDQSLSDLTIELFNYLGSTDPELRDTFAYGILARWIVLYGLHAPENLRVMIEWLVPQLSEGVGEQETDGVFLRAYSALILSLIAYHDNSVNFLEAEEARYLLDKARAYLLAERDLRAYVPEKGWANACAHTADLLRFLARNGYLEASDLRRLLDAIADKLTTETGVIFNHDEDDRLAQAVMAVFQRNVLNMYEMSEWLNRFLDWRSRQQTDNHYDPLYHATHQNIKNFLRSLYCRIQLSAYRTIDIQDFEPDLLVAIKVFSI